MTLESDHFICVREKVNEQNQVVIVDLADANNIMRRPITADSAIMHPKQKILALKGMKNFHFIENLLNLVIRTLAQRQLQVFNIDTKQKVKSHMMNEDVIFWRWISDSAVGLVTDTSVFHWSINDQNAPQKVFDRHASLVGAQIINYRATPDEKWLVLVGISGNTSNPSAFKVKGSIQLYSRERGVSQPIEGHAAAFTELQLDGNSTPSKLFTFSVRTATGAKVAFLYF